MRSSAVVLWFVVSVLVPIAGICASSGSVLDETNPALVQVVVRTSTGSHKGSGFFVDELHVVTNYHVIQPALSLLNSPELFIVPNGAKAELPATVAIHSDRSDLAILAYTGSTPHGSLALAGSTPNQLTRIFAFGYPQAVSSVATTPVRSTPMLGFLSGEYEGRWREHLDTVNILQHTANIYPGYSGGPLTDGCGRVLGINTSAAAMEARVTVRDERGGDSWRVGGSRPTEDGQYEEKSVVIAVPAPAISFAVDVDELVPLLEVVGSSYKVRGECGVDDTNGSAVDPALLATLVIVIPLAVVVVLVKLWFRGLVSGVAEWLTRDWRRYWIARLILIAWLAVVLVGVVKLRPMDNTDGSRAASDSWVLGRDWSAFRVDENGLTDLHYAAALNLPGAVGRLLDQGVRADVRIPKDGEFFGRGIVSVLGWGAVSERRTGQTPLHMAARFNAPNAVGALVERGADVLR